MYREPDPPTGSCLRHRVAALLAALRFLALEPATPRARQVAMMALSLMDAGVARGDASVTITIDPADKSAEGDFTSAGLALALGRTAGNGSAASRMRQLAALVTMVDTQLPSDRSFTLRATAPFLVAASQRGLLEPICQLLLAAQDDAAARAWVDGHAARLEALRGFARDWRP